MSTMTWAGRGWEVDSLADKALKSAAGLWFLAAVAGQWAFLYYIVAFVGPSTLSGNLELYLRVQDHPTTLGRFALAGALLVLTVFMSAGILGFYAFTQPLLARS